MTDKQEIDVTKCIHFDKSDIPNGCKCYWDGECNHDCYYKQLKRLEFKLKVTEVDYEASEQECEALQMSDNEAREIIAELKAECKKLKEKVKELNQGWIDCDKERNLQEANSEFRQRVINRYKQIFAEIEPVLELYANTKVGVEGPNGISKMIIEDLGVLGSTYIIFNPNPAKRALQKINEVLNDGTKQS